MLALNRVLTIAVCTVMHACSLLNLNQAPTYLQRNHCTDLINFDTSFFFITNMMQNSKLTINLLDHQVILAVRISQINENAISNSLCKHNTMHVASQRGKKGIKGPLDLHLISPKIPSLSLPTFKKIGVLV